MSLFDIIKYQAIDITSETELLNLPEELIHLYWRDETRSKYYDHAHKCYYLAIGAKYHYKHYHNLFMKALKKYNL